MLPKIIQVSSRKVMGFSTCFTSLLAPQGNSFEVIPLLWNRFLDRCDEIPHRINNVYLGVCDPLTPEEGLKDIRDYSYLACVEVKDFRTIPEGMMTQIIPEGLYAVFTHHGKHERLKETLTYIYRVWLEKSEYKQRLGPGSYLEHYDERFIEGSDNSEFELYVAIKK